MVTFHDDRLSLRPWTLLITVLLLCHAGCGPSEGEGGGETPAFAMKDSGETVAVTEDDPQLVQGDTFEDYHYAFRLRRPSADWRFLDEAEAKQMSPDSAMGMFHPTVQGFLVVIPERIEGVDLDGYVDLFFTGWENPVRELSEPERTKVDGFPARVTEVETTVEGIELSYRIQFVQRGSFVYCVMGWSITPNYAKVAPMLREIGESFELVREREARTRGSSTGLDDFGADWKIADGVYSNASFAFRLTPGEGFRLMGRQELQNMGPDTAAGVVRAESTFYQALVVDAIGNLDREVFSRLMLDILEGEMEVPEGGPRVSAAQVGGLEGRQWVYRDVKQAGTTFDFVQTQLFRDGTCFRLTSWWPSADREANMAHLAESYGHFEWLGPEDRQALESELAVRDASNAVGTDFSCRHGVFRDFLVGYSLRQPAGLWQIRTGDIVRTLMAGARAILSKADAGIQVYVIPESSTLGHESYHSLLLERYGQTAPPPVLEEGQEGLEILVSSFRTTANGVDLSLRLATAARGERRVQLLFSTLRGNEPALHRYLPEILLGLEMPVAPPAMVEDGQAGLLVDHRLGYRFEGVEGAPIEHQSLPGAQALGSIATQEVDGGSCAVMAMCTPAGFNEEMAVDAMIQSMRIRVEPGSRRESRSSLGGLPARSLSMSGRAGMRKSAIHLLMAERGNTSYMLAAEGRTGSGAEESANRCRDHFSLID